MLGAPFQFDLFHDRFYAVVVMPSYYDPCCMVLPMRAEDDFHMAVEHMAPAYDYYLVCELDAAKVPHVIKRVMNERKDTRQ